MAGRDTEKMRTLKEAGFEFLAYAPNPGIEPLFLSYFPWTQYSIWRDDPRRVNNGCFWDTSVTLARAGQSGLIAGSVTTSWDDSGLHIQAWMPRFVCAAEFSWNSQDLGVDVWVKRFFNEYFGPDVVDMRELFTILGASANFYYDTFQRKVWHWGDIGKIHVPDFPRQDMEYSEYWRRRYAQLLHLAAAEKQNIQRAINIIDENLARDLKNKYDLEIYRTCAELMLHNAELILMLGQLEKAVTEAHLVHYSDRKETLVQLEKAQSMIEEHLTDRKKVYENLIEVWERTRLPKGMSTPDKEFVWAPDRARHFANRTPDMRYLIMDEELLGLEKYSEDLRKYIEEYKADIYR
jgi:hexosaminidase